MNIFIGSLVALLASGLVSNVANAEDSTLCKFDSGPRAGQIQDYAPMAALPVGSACHDGVGSVGKVVSANTSSSARSTTGGSSTLCKFNRGPRAGQTQDYAPMAALPIGTPCQDGVQSTGFVVAQPR